MNVETDVCEIVKDENRINDFLTENFNEVDRPDDYRFPYKVNYKGNGRLLLFCKIPILENWAFQQDSSYCFYLVVKNDPGLSEVISTYYGHWNSHAEVEIEGNNGVNSQSSVISWHSGKTIIYLSGFRNLGRKPGLQNCSLIFIGNMDFSDIVYFASRPF